MLDISRVIFPQDRDILEDTDSLRDRIHDKVKDKFDGEKLVILDFGSTYKVRCRYKNNMLNGLVKCFNENDDMISMTQYVNDHKEGMYIKYHYNGEISCVGTFRNGECWGTWNYYNEDGEYTRSERY